MVTIKTSNISSTQSFFNSLGVNAHVEQGGSAYADPTKVASALNYLGIDYVRNHFATNALGLANVNALADKGVKFDFVPIPHWTERTVDVAAFVASLEAFEKAHPGSIAAIEGPNEVNIWTVSVNGVKSIASGAEVQKQLYAAVKQSAILKDIPVYNVTIGSTDANLHKQLGDLSAYTDYANSHAYVMSTSNISGALDYLVNFANMSAPNKPVVITEAGYTTLDSYWYNGVSEIVQAKYTLDTLMSAFDKGIAKTYLYELFDFRPDLNPNSANSHFGLFNADGSPKLAATAIHNLTTILSEDSTIAAAVSDEDFTYSLNGMPLKGQDLLLAKQDGSIDLVVWSEPVIWSQTSHTEFTTPNAIVTVTFGSLEGKVSVYDPLLGTSAVVTYFNVKEIKVNITDHPLVIEIASDSSMSSLAKSFIGDDLIQGGNGSDVLYGYGGNDELAGKDGHDTLFGGNGNDTIYGGLGTDKLYGGAAADSLIGGRGADFYDGGTSEGSIDQLNFSDASNDPRGAKGVIVDMAKSTATDPWGFAETFKNIELIKGTQFGDKMYGSARSDEFRPLGGGDAIDGRGGSDTIRYDNDFQMGGNMGVKVNLAAGKAIDGYGDMDRLSNIENAIGTDKSDVIKGSDVANELYGTGGDDKLYGGLGKDLLTGGAGSDTFVFDTKLGSSNIDKIGDFSVKADTIWLDDDVFTKVGKVGDLASGAFYIGAEAYDASDRVIYDKTTGKLFYDADGNGGIASSQIGVLSKGLALTAADFIIFA